MENKYYTPTEDEFYPGFEYEVKDTRYEYKVEKISDTKLKVISDPISTTDWFKETYTGKDFMYIEDGDTLRCNLTQYIYDEDIRVKWLDKLDIESLGFKLIEEGSTKTFGYDKFIMESNKGYFIHLSLVKFSDRVVIMIDCSVEKESEKTNVVHSIRIKNKSELKKLLKQLNINE